MFKIENIQNTKKIYKIDKNYTKYTENINIDNTQKIHKIYNKHTKYTKSIQNAHKIYRSIQNTQTIQ